MTCCAAAALLALLGGVMDFDEPNDSHHLALNVKAQLESQLALNAESAAPKVIVCSIAHTFPLLLT